ncbi:unnamed protein product [Citrullus colocynthis]|uniref:Gnk2-homologous domain-containing protein n=1 Tax=Citrullus colocynthis TaxID=252529 RepID=A0ABP0YKC3_9ROSI
MGNSSLRSRHLLLYSVISQLMFVITTTSRPDFFYYVCSNKGNYTNNSPFKKNLDNVLASISSNSNTDSRPVDYGFYNATAGEDPNTANAKILYSNNSVHDETDLSVTQIYYNTGAALDKNSFNEELRELLDRLRLRQGLRFESPQAEM